ncbi:hypothetical protein ASPVEDRAFT_84836 [Aspergillus versicolor CBS 583.65]|uniref:RNase H type-1 domain-containing protein n=1 Tax=Aspergillus versicolor CBS 583.65 TaxID=1036611 RepID=A0A1L9PPE2_ASPVE|nr:uncharacterized protein ASPVEDRAFT_84836 [Aspergillus versicolor CBS 583.65]OJJ03388.1 hypothetical protein ASPVEDRAFT_84836 [Aspergillus versicolor CBS 583.65]
MSPKESSSRQGNNKAYQPYPGPDSGTCNQAARSSVTNRPKNENKPSQGADNGRQPPEKGGKEKKNKKKKKSQNVKRQEVSENMGKDKQDRVGMGKSEVVLAATDEFPYIKIDDRITALEFAKAAKTTDEQLVLFVDGSSWKRGNHSILSHGIPTPPPTPTSSSSTPSPLRDHNGGASVVYKENNTWKYVGFSLPYIHDSNEAEVRGLEQGFVLALENAQNNSDSRNKLVVLTDCQVTMWWLAKCLTGEDVKPEMPAVAMAASKARQLRRLGMVVEVRWVPAHMGKKGAEGNSVADQIAKNALAYTSNLSKDRARELAGEVHRTENPFSRTPQV